MSTAGAPWYSSGGVEIRVGHVLDVLAAMPAGSVQTVITSPPYYGLRSYSTEPQIWGGAPDCPHTLEAAPPGKVLTGGTGTASAKQVSNAGSQYGNAWSEETRLISAGLPSDKSTLGIYADGTSYYKDGWDRAKQTKLADVDAKRAVVSATCTRCGAWRGELGSEPLPDCLAWARGVEPCSVCFVCHLVVVFRAVRRVLHDTGTCWVNLGDSMSAGKSGRSDPERPNWQGNVTNGARKQYEIAATPVQRKPPPGLGPKQLLMMPARVALALQADGWVLRSAITWAKKAPMPESIKDRPTSATEMVYLLAKQPTYYYDADAVRQPASENTHGGRSSGARATETPAMASLQTQNGGVTTSRLDNGAPNGTANLRNFWLLGPSPYPNAHFATFVPEIPRLAILAGTSARGQCPACRAPWARTTERLGVRDQAVMLTNGKNAALMDGVQRRHALSVSGGQPSTPIVTTTGWAPTCACDAGDPIPQTVCDPFSGSGTTLYVARHHGRRAVGIELNAEYAQLAADRLRQGTLGLELW